METFSALLVLYAGIHRWPVNSPHKIQWRGAFIFSLICPWINGWVNNREAGDLRRHRTHYPVTVTPHLITPGDNAHLQAYRYSLGNLLIDWCFISKKCTYIYINSTYKQIKSFRCIQRYMYHWVAARETTASLSKLAAFRLTSTWLGHELII